MSEFRLWIHERIARLDGVRERRFVALATALIFASLTLGPQALRVVAAAVNPQSIQVDQLGTTALSLPIRFRATTQNVTLPNIEFVVVTPDGTSLPPVRAHLLNTADSTRWESDDFTNPPGAGYVVRARGLLMTATGNTEIVSEPVPFTIFDPNSGAGTSEGTPKVVEILSLVAWPGTEPRIEVRGRHTGFLSSAASFRLQSITGLAYLADKPAERDGDEWHGLYAVPGGSLYQVTLMVPDAGTTRQSLVGEVLVPAADAPPPTGTTEAPAPAHQPAVAFLLPSAGVELMGPVPLAARVTNATATNVVFEIIDPAGVTRSVPAGAGANGDWTAMFTGAAGQYGVGVRTFLPGNVVIPPFDFRSFRILAPPTESATSTLTQPAGTETVPPAAATIPEPTIEIFSPAETAQPFPGAVPISSRVRNGLPEKVVALVKGASGNETIVIASKSATGDYWTALFEGVDGEYRYRVRALVAGKELLTTERRFSIKRPLAAAGPSPTTDVPPTSIPSTGVPYTAPDYDDDPSLSTGVPYTAPDYDDDPSLVIDANRVEAEAGSDAGRVPEAMAVECREAGIMASRCDDWLMSKHQSRECLAAGAFTRESCAALLARMNLPSDASQMYGLPGAEEIDRARQDAMKLGGASVRRDELPASIAAMVPVQNDQTARVRMFAVANHNEASSPALLVIDTDGDGLPDDVERRFGSDPRAIDTDGDGFSDGEEVKNGYSPIGNGPLNMPVRGIEKALLAGLPIEEPRGAETLVDTAFTIAAKEAASEDGAESDVIRLSGAAAPNTVVTIFVYSYLPVVVTTTTDENGNWTYDFGSKLADGRHEAYVSVNDETGKLVASSSPLTFFVREAQAVSEEDFLRPDINVEEAPATFSRWFIWGGLALVALALLLVIAIIRQTRKHPMTDAGGGV